MCFTETHPDDWISDVDLTIDSHDSTIYRYDLTPHSGGILVYVSNAFISKRRCDLEIKSVHALWVEIKYRATAFLLCRVYRLPGTPVSFWDNFNVSVERAFESNSKLIIVGDSNQNLLNPNEYHLTNFMALNNVQNVINKPTRVTPYCSKLLDPILVSSFVNVLHSDTVDVEDNISDHKATEILLKFINVPKPCSKRKVWYYESADFVQLNNLIENYNWDFITASDINQGCEKFSEIFLNLSSQCIASKEITVRPTDKPWYDSEIRRCSRQRNRQKNMVVRFRRNNNWERFKQVRNRVYNLKKVAKERCFSHLDESLSQYRFENPSKYWKHLRNLINMNKKTESMSILKKSRKRY